MKQLLFSFALLLLLLETRAESKLKFDANNTFKIVQFTDTHFYIGGERSDEVLQNMRAVLDTERPNLVVLTGDIVTGTKPNWPTLESWEVLTNVLIEYKVPYAIVFGNHDDEAQKTRADLLTYLAARPYCLIADEGGEKVAGIGNYVLPVYNSKDEVAQLLYCMDSHAYSLFKEEGVGGYGWFDRSQIEWFAQRNEQFLNTNKNLKALCFFHIPLPEYQWAYDHGQFKRGVRMEDECAPIINTGMFAEMVQQGNVWGTFVGHDHNNNYVAQHLNIALCYGYFSGGNTYGDLPLNGARVILLEEGSSQFKTWIRRQDNKKLYEVSLPHSKKK